MTRIAETFARCRNEQRAAFIPFIMAGDPSHAACAALLASLPAAGADIIELGIPFSDPMADGPTIQRAGQRALAGGMTLTGLLELVRRFRVSNADTPLILMGYYNPIFRYGEERFARDAAAAGLDQPDRLAASAGSRLVRRPDPRSAAPDLLVPAALTPSRNHGCRPAPSPGRHPPAARAGIIGLPR